ncbi:MAG: ferritin family protein [Promethearchaeota archaeon]
MVILRDLFLRAIENEEMARDFYLDIALLFSLVPNVAEFWESLSTEEQTHAELLLDALKNTPEEKLSAPADPSLIELVNEVHDLLTRDYLGDITTLDDAFELAHEVEFSEINNILKILLAHSPSFGDRKSEVVTSITEHQDKLMKFSESLGGRDWRRGILAEKK